MGICNSVNKKEKGPQPKTESSIPNHVPSGKKYDMYEEMRSRFKMEIKESPFNNYGHLQQEELESEYNHSKSANPYTFIEGKPYQLLYKKTYETCYLKCEPILNIITDDKKKGDLLFFRIVIFLQTNVNDIQRKMETAKRILIESYEQRHRKINLEQLKTFVNAVTEVCIEIVIYFGMLPFMLKKENLLQVFTEEGYRLNDKYYKIELDDYYFDVLVKKTQVDMIKIKDTWLDFIFQPILALPQNNDAVMEIKESRFSFNGSFPKNLNEISDVNREEITCRLSYMFEPIVFFESMIGNGIDGFSTGLYKTH